MLLRTHTKKHAHNTPLPLSCLQGYADNSTWSRGQAWAMAGFSKLYEETNLPEFRDTAIKVTDR